MKVWDEVYQARMSVVYQQLYPDTVQELSGFEEELPKWQWSNQPCHNQAVIKEIIAENEVELLTPHG